MLNGAGIGTACPIQKVGEFQVLTWKQFKAEVRQRLGNGSHLRPVFDDLYDIGRRIREVDDTLFIVRNIRLGRYEVHCLEHKPNTYAWVVPWDCLDGRVLEKAMDNRIERHGDPDGEVKRYNDDVQRRMDRDMHNRYNDLAREMHPAFRKLAYDPG